MTFTKLQLRSLKVYLSWHTRPPNFAVLARSSLRSWVALALVAGLGCLIVEWGYPEAGWLVIGMMGGAFLRDIGRYRVLLKVWPAHDEVTDWERVRQVLNEQDGATKIQS